ncbi:CotO family spore coat protein [Bacillus safensis]|uniref:CotO family spore coat protein n=1 Tax=Bacillus safensis TaxID=561879 RepID=UPI002559AFA0|nr:CotO family spore coat protein [Bacillus safensis]
MSNKGDENQKPLMYIVQPSYHESKPAMQNIVRKRKKSEKQSERDHNTKGEIDESMQQEPAAQEIEQKKEAEPPKLQQERDIKQAAEFTEERDIKQEAELTQEGDSTQEAELTQEHDIIQEPEPQQEERNEPEGVFHETKEEPRRKRVKKPLSQMSIDEKVDFLTRLPHNMPRALCLIEADGKTYRGIIMDRKDDTVIIRTAGGGNPVELAIAEITSIHPLGF